MSTTTLESLIDANCPASLQHGILTLDNGQTLDLRSLVHRSECDAYYSEGYASGYKVGLHVCTTLDKKG